MRSLCPAPLKSGDTIGLVTPSSPLVPDAIEAGVQFLEKNGFKVKLGNHIYDSDRFLAGNDIDRAKDLMDFFKDSTVKAIIATRGGQGSQRLLPLLDYDVIRSHPKILIGFSDTTALQLGLLKKTKLVTYTGFTLTLQPNTLIEQTLMACLFGKSYRITEGIGVCPGIAKGPIVGGNLTLLTTLMGTPFQPEFEGSILLIEDINIEPYNLDRMFSQLDLAGIFNQVAGIIIGQFENSTGKDSNSLEGTVDDVINEWISHFKVPCIKDFPYGHGAKRCVLPIGKDVILNADLGILTVI